MEARSIGEFEHGTEALAVASQNGTALRLPDRAVLEQRLLQQQLRLGIPGLAVEVSLGDKVEEVALGALSIDEDALVTTDSTFSIACLVRFLVSATALKLASEDAIDLDTPIASYLPELDTSPDCKARTIHIRHLMMQTSGFVGPLKHKHEWSWDTCVDHLRNSRQLFQPGTVFCEEPLNHVLLGEILRRHFGLPVIQLVRDVLLTPAGATVGSCTDGSSVHPRFVGHKLAASGSELVPTKEASVKPELWQPAVSNLTLTVGDMARIARYLTDPKTGAWYLQSLSRPVVKLPLMATAGRNPKWNVQSFTSSCAAFPRGVFGHFSMGHGQSAALTFSPSHRLCVCVTVNIPRTAVSTHILDAIYSMFAGYGQETPPEIGYAQILGGFRPQQLAGVYEGATEHPVMVSVNGARLRVTAERGLSVLMGPLQNGRLMLETRYPVNLSFFANPANGAPCLMLGMTALKRRA